MFRSSDACVAVVIPCFNHGRFLRDAVDSVHAQDWPRVECVVVDDGSTDSETIAAMDALQAEGVRVIRQENQGLAAARNAGVNATDAPFFVPLDADDKIAPQFISKLLPPLLEDPSIGYVYSHVSFFGAARGVWECLPYDPCKLLVQNLSTATALIRRSAFDLVAGYQSDMVHGFEDWDFWLALLAAGYQGRCVGEPLFFYRKHPPGESMLESTQRHRTEMVHKMIEHHRALFASMLEMSMTDKDAMSSPTEDLLYQALLAQAELDYIENSRSWQTIQRLKRTRVYRTWAGLVHGKDWDKTPRSDPRDKLAAIKRSRFYRLLRAVKKTTVYRIYARRKYGPEFVDLWT